MIAQANGVLDSFLVSGAADAFDIGNGGVLRVQQAFLQLVICVDNDPVGAAMDLAAAYTKNPAGFAALANTTDVYNGATVLNAVESYTQTGNTGEFVMAMELAKYPPVMDLSAIASLAAFGYELTPVADAIGVVTAAANGDIAGIMIAGVGFLPIAKAGQLLGKAASGIEATLKAGGDEAGKLADDIAREAGRYAQVGGHHVHAKAAFKSHMNYNPKDGFSISQEFVDAYGLRHADMTSYQRRAFDELARSGNQIPLRSIPVSRSRL